MKRQGIYNHKKSRNPPYQVKGSNLDPEIIMGNRDFIREVSVEDYTIYGLLPLFLVEGYGIRISSGWGLQWISGFIFFEYIIGWVTSDHIGLPDMHQRCLLFWFEEPNEMDGLLKAHMIGSVIDGFIQPEGLNDKVVWIEELRRKPGDFSKIGCIYHLRTLAREALKFDNEPDRTLCKGTVKDVKRKDLKLSHINVNGVRLN